jgi:hypothetical protein
MMQILPSIVLSAAFGLLCFELSGCKRTPSPPTEQDAIAVWKHTHANPHLSDLVSLKKTNGALEESNGTKIYTLYYEATERYAVKLGNAEPGTTNTYKGNYPFQWTEKGWLGQTNRSIPKSERPFLLYLTEISARPALSPRESHQEDGPDVSLPTRNTS